MEKDIREEINGEGQILIDHLGIETGVLPSCKSVQGSTHRVNLLGDVKGSSFLRPLEKKMFNKMRDPIFMGLLISGPGDDPHSDGHRPEVRDFLCNHPESVIEDGLLIPGSGFGPKLIQGILCFVS